MNSSPRAAHLADVHREVNALTIHLVLLYLFWVMVVVAVTLLKIPHMMGYVGTRKYACSTAPRARNTVQTNRFSRVIMPNPPPYLRPGWACSTLHAQSCLQERSYACMGIYA